MSADEADRELLRSRGVVFGRQSVDLPEPVFRDALAEAAELVVQALIAQGRCDAGRLVGIFTKAGKRERSRIIAGAIHPAGSA